jgi:hypothetical protein
VLAPRHLLCGSSEGAGHQIIENGGLALAASTVCRDQARLANRLDEATGQLRVELAARWEANVELEAMRTSAT